MLQPASSRSILQWPDIAKKLSNTLIPLLTPSWSPLLMSRWIQKIHQHSLPCSCGLILTTTSSMCCPWGYSEASDWIWHCPGHLPEVSNKTERGCRNKVRKMSSHFILWHYNVFFLLNSSFLTMPWLISCPPDSTSIERSIIDGV